MMECGRESLPARAGVYGGESMSVISQLLKEEVAQSAVLLFERRLTPAKDFGDTSLRDRQTGLIYILPRPSARQPIRNWSKVTADDVAVIDIHGRNMADPDVLPTVEAPMHLRIYQARPEVNGIVHSHGEWSSVFAGVRQGIPAVTLDALEVIGTEEIRCAAYGRIASEELAKNVVDALGARSKAALMANHGAVCIGATLEEAFDVAQLLEKVSMQVVLGRILGKPVPITWKEFGEVSSHEGVASAP